MVLKQLVFFDFDSVIVKPIAPGISEDQGRNDKFFHLELYLPKSSLTFKKRNFQFIESVLPENIYAVLPESLFYNMELFAMGNLKKGDFTEYVLFFKPWFVHWEEKEDYLDYLENFIYIVPYRILNHFLAKGIYLKNFNFKDLRNARVIQEFNDTYFNNFLKDYERISKLGATDLGMKVAENIYKETGEITINKEYLISLNNKYLF